MLVCYFDILFFAVYIVIVTFINDNAFFLMIQSIILAIRYKLEESEKQTIIHDVYFFQLWVPSYEHQV